MNWIKVTDIAEIRKRVAAQTFVPEITNTYYWYVRYFWFSLAAFWFIATVITLGHDRRTGEGLVLCTLVGMYYHVQWRRHCEMYVLQLEMKRNQASNQASEATSEPAPGAASSSPQG